MAQFTEDQLWYRCKVMALQPTDRTANVLYVDYGNSEHVLYEKLKPLRKTLKKVKAVGIECKLDNVFPVSAREWKIQANAVFKRILSEL